MTTKAGHLITLCLLCPVVYSRLTFLYHTSELDVEDLPRKKSLHISSSPRRSQARSRSPSSVKFKSFGVWDNTAFDSAALGQLCRQTVPNALYLAFPVSRFLLLSFTCLQPGAFRAQFSWIFCSVKLSTKPLSHYKIFKRVHTRKSQIPAQARH